jgi:eukaryotic-like serine/threonine-protein kinase
MPEDLKIVATRLSASEFLTALERSEVLPSARSREVVDRLRPAAEGEDSLVMARQLVHEGVLTPFQARRLLKGKRGLVFGRYILLDHIGQGARGRVYKARHRLMDRVVALKVVRADPAIGHRWVPRFFREMKIVGLLDHPNVVRAIDADIHEGCPYIVMECLEGEDLEEVFAHRGALPPTEVISYMAQAARGLAHAHEKGVIHRDVKPTNLFLVNTGVVKVLDLGFGELVGAAQQSGDAFDTDEGIVVGTTDFMSPEQVKRRPIDARTDLFSLGCTMYRLLTGDFAYPGLTREDRLVKRISQPPVPITDVRPDLPSGLVRIVDRLLAPRPADRFGSATETAEALEALVPASRRTSGRVAESRSDEIIAPIHAEPEPPLDWSVIESALRPSDKKPRSPSSRLVDRQEPRSPSSKGLSSHRKSLEDEGMESGREVHDQYRSELVQMNRVMAELRSMNPEDEASHAGPTWFERIGEKLGDYLAEPTPGPIIIVGLVVLIILGLALAFAVG